MAPNDPNNPQGPPTNNPINPDPGLTGKMNDLEGNVTAIEGLLTRMEGHLAKAGQRADELGKKFKNVNLELSTAVTLAGDTEEAVKEIANAAKTLRKGILDTKSSKDALATVTAIHKAQQILLEKTQSMPAAQAKVKRQMQEMQAWMEKLEHTTGDLAENDMLKLQKALHEVGKEGENVAKIFKGIQISHLNRQIGGVTGALRSFGIGKGYAGKVDKYTGYGETAFKLREAQKARFEGNKEMFKEKRDAALKSVQDKYGVDLTSPKAQFGKRAAQMELSKALGIDTRGMSDKDLTALAGGAPTAKATDIENKYHGTGLTGVISKVATSTESGLANIGEVLAEAAPVLAALEGAIMLLVEAFDGWVAQNKAMETGLGKGGLFTTGMGGRGFTGARAGLTPDSAYTALGLSFDRNLKIAQSIAEQGYGIQDVVNAGQTEELTGQKVVGPAGQGFMAGGTGMIQRAAVGAGRIAGLTDAEGVERVMKLLEEYRETLQQGENFFIQTSKGAKAAGLSTTKYISIIDDVMGQFDRMNRSLDSTVAVLGQLSKTGRLAGEDLQQYFKFLTGGMGAQQEAGTTEQMFLLKNMGTGARGDVAKNQADMMQNLVNRAIGAGGKPAELVGAAGIPGITAEMIQKGFGGTSADMTGFIRTKLQPAMNNSNADPTTKKSWNNLIEQMRDQKDQQEMWGDFAKGKLDAVGMGLGTKGMGMNMQSSMGLQQAALQFILRAGSLQEFAKNPGEFFAKHKETAFLSDMFKNDPLMLKTLRQTQEGAAGMRLEAAQKEPEGGPEMKKLYNDMKRKGYFKGNFAEFEKGVRTNGKDFLDNIADLDTTMSYWGQASVKQQADASEEERMAAIGEAKKVGAQTQSMAEIIAHAFSKWFNNIIEGLEAIVDLMPGGDKGERAQRKKDAADFLGPQGKNAKDTTFALGTIQESIDYQNDLADRAKVKGDSDAEKAARQKAGIMQDQMDRIVGMQQSQTFYDPAQEEEFRGFIKQYAEHGAATRQSIAAGIAQLNAPAPAAAAASTGDTIITTNHNYDATINQNTTSPSSGSAAVANTEHPAVPKPQRPGQ